VNPKALQGSHESYTKAIHLTGKGQDLSPQYFAKNDSIFGIKGTIFY